MNAALHLDRSRQVDLCGGLRGGLAGGSGLESVHPVTPESFTQAANPAASETDSSGNVADVDPRERFKAVLRFRPAEFRVFLLLGQGKTITEICRLDGECRARSTVAAHVDALRHFTGKTIPQLMVFSAAFQESGLQRVVNEEYSPYRFADKLTPVVKTLLQNEHETNNR